MGFAEVHASWLEYHLRKRSGERRSRLERGHAHGEQLFLKQVWWPIFGHLDDLHPEYEVSDWRGKPYFVDFAWMPGKYKLAIEVKGFGSHVQDMDRLGYRRELNREIYLQVMEFRVIAVPYDELKEQPQLMISLLKALLTPYMIDGSDMSAYTRLERDVIRLARRRNESVRPVDLVIELGINRRTSVSCLAALCEKGKFKPIKLEGSTRICRYEYIHSISDQWLL